MKWYNKQWVIILFCIFLPPVGIVMIWLHPTLSKQARVAWTLIVGFFSLAAVALFTKYKDQLREKVEGRVNLAR